MADKQAMNESVTSLPCLQVPSGYSGVRNVLTGGHTNLMPSFWLAETLKYVFLIFSPKELFPLNQWVFNTEGHMFKRFPQTSDSIKAKGQRGQ